MLLLVLVLGSQMSHQPRGTTKPSVQEQEAEGPACDTTPEGGDQADGTAGFPVLSRDFLGTTSPQAAT